jgi:hypothetical protein
VVKKTTLLLARRKKGNIITSSGFMAPAKAIKAQILPYLAGHVNPFVSEEKKAYRGRNGCLPEA